MTDNPLSNIPGRITASALSANMLEAAVAELLRRIPDTWQAHKPDDLSETQEQALFLLTAAGMVERRERLRLRFANHPVVAEATITMTGEYGGIEAFERLAARLWDDWEDAYAAWKHSDAANVSPAHCERLEPSEWRLTPEGVMARQDLDGGEQARVFDFVLKRGFFDDRPRMMPDGRVTRREPVRGKGALVKMRKAQGEPATAATVSLANWQEGAEAFAKAFGGLAALVQPPAPAAQAVPAGRRSAQRRRLRCVILLWFTLFVAVELAVAYGAWCCGEGVNLWQKILASWPYLTTVAAACLGGGWAHAGREGRQLVMRWKGED